MYKDEAISTLKNTAWLGTEEDRAKVGEAIAVLERQPDIEAIRQEIKESGMKFDTWRYDMAEVSTVLDIIDKHMKGDTE